MKATCEKTCVFVSLCLCLLVPSVAPRLASGQSVPAGTDPRGLRVTCPGDPATSLTIAWNTATAAPDPRVQYGTTALLGSEQAAQTRDIDTGTYYWATLTGLTPDARYYYRVGSAGHWSQTLTTRTAPEPGAPDRPIRFLVWGDSRTDRFARGNLSARARAHVDAIGGIDFTIHTGDIVSSGEIQAQWDAYFEDTSPINSHVPCYYVAGNHEYDSNENTVMYDNLELPSNGQNSWYYAASYGVVDFVGLDTNPHVQKGFYEDMKVQWLRTALDNARNRKYGLWTITAFHEPLYSSQRGRPDRDDLKALWGTEFDGNVDLVVVGHNHYYARTYPVNSRGEYNASSRRVYYDPPARGQWIHAIAGGAGAPLYGNKYQDSPLVAQFNGTYHFMLGTISVNATHTRMAVETWEMWPLAGGAGYSALNLMDAFAVVKPLPGKFTNPAYVAPTPRVYTRPPAWGYVLAYILVAVAVTAACLAILRVYWKTRHDPAGTPDARPPLATKGGARK